MWSNTLFMIRHAWRICRVVLLIASLQVVLGLAMNLIELYVTPGILKAIENAAELSELLKTIGLFAAGLILAGAAQSYVDANALCGRITLRTLILIRWIAITGQLATVAAVQLVLGFPLPLGPVLAAIGA